MTERISSSISSIESGGIRVEFDGNRDCAECGDPGAAKSGLCMKCLSKAMSPRATMKSREGRAVQKRANAVKADIKASASRSLDDAIKATTRELRDAAAPLPPAAEPTPSLTIELDAYRCAVAWLNAYLAHSEDEARPQLYRTLAVEVFEGGVQFVGCDGHMLFRTWAPLKAQPNADMPLLEEAPERTVVVMDVEKFAQGFVRTLKSTASQEENKYAPAAITIEEAPPTDQPLLGEAFAAEVLVLRAFGQRLTCRLYDGEFVNWRAANFGLKAGEQVDGLKLSVRLFATAGKLSGFLGLDCAFHGENSAIEIYGKGDHAEVRGLLMPMRRESEKATSTDSNEE
jgi:hypothetical protein